MRGRRALYHDIAVIRLKVPLELNPYVQPVCLPRDDFVLPTDKNVSNFIYYLLFFLFIVFVLFNLFVLVCIPVISNLHSSLVQRYLYAKCLR